MKAVRRRGADAPSGDAAIRSPARPAARVPRWGRGLVWFMRLMALLWIAKGLSFWAVIVGAGHGPSFEAKGLGFQATVVYFAVIDLVAAVGLWLTSAWGGVLWLLAVMSQLILWFFFPNLVPGNVVTAIVYGSFIFAYLLLSWLAAREEES
ncbi:MAG TPA: DUF6163 family protein [Salinarimonas sp.]|jgi:hypothetical protein|nr:DUF6163 family protein [Salinarimonas sp.]